MALLQLSFDVLDDGESPKMSVRNDDELKSAADNGASCEPAGPSFREAIFSFNRLQVNLTIGNGDLLREAALSKFKFYWIKTKTKAEPPTIDKI